MHSPIVVMAGTEFAAVREFLIEALPSVQFEQVEVATLRAKGYVADVLLPAMSLIDGGLMDRIEGLRLIQQWGAGLEGVDIAAATERKIAVANVPTGGTGNAESVAEWCIMAAIALSRRLHLAQENIRAGGKWGAPLGRALMGRTAGIVGLGGIGRALASRLNPFGMRLIGLQRRPDPTLAERLGMEWVGGPERLGDLLRRTEYLFLCVPLSEQTRQIIDEAALAMLPPHACIINAARGGLVSTQAMLRALAEGRLIGAGLDVFEREPLDPASPLLRRPDVIATSHIAGVTDVSYRGIARGVSENIVRILGGQPPHHCVNWEAINP
jgi:phosphoglycerate dehydrogenase-like enzyme